MTGDETCLMKVLSVRPTRFCSGQGFVTAERSLAVISIDLLDETHLVTASPHTHRHMFLSCDFILTLTGLFVSHSSSSLCFS